MSKQLARLSQKSFEWYTPPEYIHAACEALGGPIDLDPASCELANKVIQAGRIFTKEQDGLLQPWTAARLWLNPPYCKSGAISNQEIWSCKLIAEYEAGNVEQAILLVNGATETAWFQRLCNHVMCFKKGKIRFLSEEGINTGPTVGSVFVYFGSHEDRFIEVFSKFGRIAKFLPVSTEAGLWDKIA